MNATAELPGTDRQVAVATILQKSVCLVLRCSRLGTGRRVNLTDVELETEGQVVDETAKRRLSMRKRLVASKSLAPVERVLDAAVHFLRSVSTAGHRLFGDGTYLVATGMVGEVEDRLMQFATRLEEKKLEVVGRWAAVREESAAALGPLFRDDEFPTAAQVLAEYGLEWSYIAFGAPEQLADVDHAAYERAQQVWQRRLAEAHDEVILQLREAALRVMRELAIRLRPNANGHAKALHPTALRDLQDLLARLPVLDLSGDGALADIMAGVGSRAEGLDVETLRKAPAVRAMLLEQAERAVEQLDGLVSTGRRAISFDGEL